MSVKIRLRRTGANNAIAFRIVATDSRSPRDGRIIELLGWYDPKVKGKNYEIKVDRLDYWVSKGAIVSDTVNSLVKQNRAKTKKQA
jgi:small subunit ribosomal protein S16